MDLFDHDAMTGSPSWACRKQYPRKGCPTRTQRVLKYKQQSRFLAPILIASLFAGCQPAGTGSIDVDAKDPSVKGFKSIEPAKRPKSRGTSKQPDGTKSAPRTSFR
jgi:hypothetical protein